MAPQRLSDGFPRRQSKQLPRVGLFGEFSTGKSSVVNLLLGRDVLPTAVLASTRRPTAARYAAQLGIEAVSQDGSRAAIPADAMEAFARDDISSFDVGMPIELLRCIELLDTAGFADPYQDTRLTFEVADNIDVCIWCTLATQAWRASEQKTWRSLPGKLRSTSILVVTHIDNIVNSSDLQRIEARLRRETAGQFSSIVLLSVPDATRARGADDLIADPKLWQSSGGEQLLAAMRGAISNIPDGVTADRPDSAIVDQAMGLKEAASNETASKAAAPKETAPKKPAAKRAVSKKVDIVAVPPKAATESAPPPPPPAPSAPPPAAPSPAPPPAAAATAGASAAFNQLYNLNVRVFLLKVMATVPSCLTAAWIDLNERRVTHYVGADAQEATESPLGAAVTGLFQGEQVQRIEAIFKATRSGQAADRHYFREIVVIGPDCLSIMLRSPAEAGYALVIVSDKGPSLGLVLTTARGLLNSSAAELRQ